MIRGLFWGTGIGCILKGPTGGDTREAHFHSLYREESCCCQNWSEDMSFPSPVCVTETPEKEFKPCKGLYVKRLVGPFQFEGLSRSGMISLFQWPPGTLARRWEPLSLMGQALCPLASTALPPAAPGMRVRAVLPALCVQAYIPAPLPRMAASSAHAHRFLVTRQNSVQGWFFSGPRSPSIPVLFGLLASGASVSLWHSGAWCRIPSHTMITS